MMIIAALGSAFGMHCLCELLVGPGLAFPLQGATWLTWFIVGLIATCTIARRGAGHLVRFGIWGFTRPRWWFEVARLAWLATLLDALVLVFVVSVLPRGLRGPIADVATLPLFVLGPAACAWIVAATTGYVLAWVRWLPMRGKAFDCVQYFYTIMLSIALAASGVYLFEANKPWFERALAGVIGTVGGVLFVVGFISIIRRWERNERRAVALRQ